MSLSASLNIAQSALASTAAQSSVLSRNIGNVNTPNYARRSAKVVTAQSGSSSVASVQRATNTALFSSTLQAQSNSAAQSAVSDGLAQIENTLGLDQASSTSTSAVSATDQSPSTKLAALTDALQTYAAAPDLLANGTAVATAAKDLAASLNQSSNTIQQVRAQADNSIASAVQTVNDLLGQFQGVNQQIVVGTATGADITDAQDARDSILSQLSSQIGITTYTTANGGTSIYTDSGITLFDQSPRQVSFTPTRTYASGTTGGAVTVDGLAITGASAVTPLQSGAIAGLTQLRDTTAVSYQNQLDQIAGSLISTFAETGSSGTAPALAGLFTNAGSSTVPASGAVSGLAANITVNASVDPAKGGNVTLLRDGNVSGGNGAAASGPYTYNATGAAAYSGHLNDLVSALGATRSFDPSSGATGSGSLATYAASSVSWLTDGYKTATNAATYQSSIVSSATTALSNATGVNLDDQLSQTLDIEHAYQASAQLLNVIGKLYSSLITALN